MDAPVARSPAPARDRGLSRPDVRPRQRHAVRAEPRARRRGLRDPRREPRPRRGRRRALLSRARRSLRDRGVRDDDPPQRPRVEPLRAPPREHARGRRRGARARKPLAACQRPVLRDHDLHLHARRHGARERSRDHRRLRGADRADLPRVPVEPRVAWRLADLVLHARAPGCDPSEPGDPAVAALRRPPRDPRRGAVRRGRRRANVAPQDRPLRALRGDGGRRRLDLRLSGDRLAESVRLDRVREHPRDGDPRRDQHDPGAGDRRRVRDDLPRTREHQPVLAGGPVRRRLRRDGDLVPARFHGFRARRGPACSRARPGRVLRRARARSRRDERSCRPRGDASAERERARRGARIRSGLPRSVGSRTPKAPRSCTTSTSASDGRRFTG